MMRPTEIRGVLRYVREFKDKFVVLAIDGSVINHPNFSNVLVDVAVLRSLNIKIGIVHGAAHEIERIANKTHVTLSDFLGNGVTDEQTLKIAMQASNNMSQKILEGLASVDLKGAITNSLEAHPLGILKGVNHAYSGKVEKVDRSFVQTLLDHNIIPVMPCVAGNGENSFYRINSDQVAVSLATQLQAIKIIFLTSYSGLEENGQLVRQLPSQEAEAMTKRLNEDNCPMTILSKLKFSVRACKSGVSRIHIIDGTIDGNLLHEVFSKDGVGTLIYSNDFENIRQARTEDIRSIISLTQSAVDDEELIHRSRNEIENQIEDYYLFIMDGQLLGCIALHQDSSGQLAELAYLYVHPNHENQGIGRKLIKFIERKAQELGIKILFALSTQTYSFFVQKAGFQEGSIEDLPAARTEKYLQNGRQSKVLIKTTG